MPAARVRGAWSGFRLARAGRPPEAAPHGEAGTLYFVLAVL